MNACLLTFCGFSYVLKTYNSKGSVFFLNNKFHFDPGTIDPNSVSKSVDYR